VSLREVIAELDVKVRGLGEVRAANAELDGYVATVRPAISRIEGLRVKQAEHSEMAQRLAQRLRQLQGAQGDNSQAILETRVAMQRATAASRQYGTAANEAEQRQRRAADGATTLGVALGVAAAAAYAARQAFALVGRAIQEIEAMIEEGSRIDDLSQQLGVSAQRLQEWEFLAGQSGSTLETITRGLEQVARTAGRGADVYGRLGVATRDSSGELRSQEAILDDTLSALAGVESSTERTALAQQVFGRGAREMLGIVAQGPEELGRLRSRFRELGAGMSEDGVRASADAGDAMEELRVSMRSLRDTLAPFVLPALSALFREIASGIGWLTRLAQQTTLLRNLSTLGGMEWARYREQMRLVWRIARLAIAPFVALVLVVDDLMTGLRGGRSVIGSWVESLVGAYGPAMTFVGVIEALRIRLLALRQSAYDAAEAVLSVVPGGGEALAQLRAARDRGASEIKTAREQLAAGEVARFAERNDRVRSAAVRSGDAGKAAAAATHMAVQTTVNVQTSDPEAAARAVAREQRREIRRAADAIGRAPAREAA
jgi:hypothetical protein